MRTGIPLAAAVAIAIGISPAAGAGHSVSAPKPATAAQSQASSPPVRASQSQDGPPFNLDAPFILDAPRLTGTFRAGELIVAKRGSWAGPGPQQFTNRWERCDTARCLPTGQTGFSTRLVAADVGKRMRAVVTASNSTGSAEAHSAQSALVKPKLRRIRPFPVVALKGFITPRGTYVSRLAVRAPAGSTVRLHCRGRGCPFRRHTIRFRRHFVVVRRLRARTLAVGTRLSLRVTQKGRIGKYTRFRIRRGRRPARIDRCLLPGSANPARCPARE